MTSTNFTTESDERTASLLMATTFTLTGEFYDWVNTTTNDDRARLMERYARPGDVFLRVIGPWAIELVAQLGGNANDRIIAEIFNKEFLDRLFGKVQEGGIGAEIGTPGVQQGPPPDVAPGDKVEDAVS